MIRSIAGGQGIVVSGSTSNSPYIDMSRHSAGMVRYNGNNLEVYDGSSWMIMQSSYPMIELSPDVHELLQWAKEKRNEEFRIKELIKNTPAVQAAYNQVKDAQERLEVIVALVKEQSI